MAPGVFRGPATRLRASRCKLVTLYLILLDILSPCSTSISSMTTENDTHGSTSSNLLRKIEINVDCGEAFGLWEGGPDEELMPMIDAANVACGGHAGDPVTMQKTVALAKKYGIKVGARAYMLSLIQICQLISDPGFPDKVGFGRRMIAMSSEQIYAEM